VTGPDFGSEMGTTARNPSLDAVSGRCVGRSPGDLGAGVPSALNGFAARAEGASGSPVAPLLRAGVFRGMGAKWARSLGLDGLSWLTVLVALVLLAAILSRGL
jgi:hypothetical protein